MFQEALTAEPYNVTAAYSAALALTRAGKADEGRQAMQAFESLRDSVYGVTYAQTYLAQGKYGEAIASTGAEPELVNPAAPDVTFSDATGDVAASDPRPAPRAERGGLTLFDADSDGDLDLVRDRTAGPAILPQRQRRSSQTRPPAPVLTAVGEVQPAGAIAGDYDNDGRPDLFLLRDGGHSLLLHQKADGASRM